MLTDEQLEVLGKGNEAWYNLYRNGTATTAKTICRLMGDLATALLARQRLERQLEAARGILEEMWDYLPIGASDTYERMKQALESEAQDVDG